MGNSYLIFIIDALPKVNPSFFFVLRHEGADRLLLEQSTEPSKSAQAGWTLLNRLQIKDYYLFSTILRQNLFLFSWRF
jgi:hypothetical protein